MFELPDAKRVRRDELYESSSDRHSSPERDDAEDAELRAKLNARLSGLLSVDLGPPGPAPATTNIGSQSPDGANQAGVDSEPKAAAKPEFEFRLFSTSAPSQKVVLVPDDEEFKYDGPAISQRPLSHYIRGELTPREREQFRFAAVTAHDVRAWAQQRAWGLEVPWRVTKLTVTAVGGKGATGPAAAAPAAADGLLRQQSIEGSQGMEKTKTKKKTRPGKKSRIVLRKRKKAKEEAAAALEKQRMSKEEHLREKKKRLNREKKLKRRRKEKEKKLAAKGAAGEGDGARGSGSEAGSAG
ncbi:8219fa1a-9cb8-4db2-8826-d286493f0173 [Thermothielavioides terrestris]|uniref:Uncharacterized protein n=2 Tax=Thermothielavioides terrestris TaxID=2587410 RepID=G2QST4_THETT|nr:uncharacterized protein THITE_2107093 [Thermothielavioides terrestris NRRL 8126]AEO62659.1 hypothetical protein THITE_2107093 [Thermothielavioides terrestris NRRL 8126]SPQ21845.1 8219fa1a-9cb8-4db2-8826-d286493f0173 [Thermothielavioides terrestris]